MMMNPAIDHLLQKLFRANNLEEAPAPDIHQLAGRYPYYAPLQYLLASKYRRLDDTQYRLQITKTAVFFSNPHWLNNLLLSDEDDPASGPVNTSNGAVPGVPPLSDSIEEEQVSAVQEGEDLPMDEPVSSQVVQADKFEVVSPVTEDVMLPEHPEQNDPAPEEALPVEKAGTDDDTITADAVEMLSPNALEAFPGKEDQVMLPPEEILSPVETDAAEPPEEISDKVPASFPNNTSGESSDSPEETFKNEPGPAEQPGSGSVVADDEPVVKEEIVPQEGIYATDPFTMMSEKVSLEPSPDTGNNLPVIPFEPLYTVDYFASQGIRLTNEEGSDKLSRKLRSFTEWLRTMKRIHPEKLEQEMDRGKAAAIQHIAEHSNELEDVVTEAMAEVYARQGLRAKAAEVYQKLSLLNPNKRAYFAARISKLNDI